MPRLLRFEIIQPHEAPRALFIFTSIGNTAAIRCKSHGKKPALIFFDQGTECLSGKINQNDASCYRDAGEGFSIRADVDRLELIRKCDQRTGSTGRGIHLRQCPA
jgi:hypothetical protein